MNKFNNTNNESALTKQFKSNGCVGLQGSNNNDNRTNDRKAPDEPPEGSWWMKVSLLGCAISKSMHSSSRVRNKHLAASYCNRL